MKLFAALLGLLVLLFAIACDDDPAQPQGGTPPSFEPLTTREAVVNNLEKSWNQRRDDKFAELLDYGFKFYFSPEDILSGLPTKWDVATEVSAVHEWFVSDDAPEHEGPRCVEMRVDLVYHELEWVEVPAQWGDPNDVWYKTTVPYTYTFEMEPNTTFIAPNGAMAELTVKPDGDEWRLVEWRDLAYGSARSISSMPSTSVPSWGAIKSLYEPAFLQLITRDAVLVNLEAAWNERHPGKLDELLDSDFEFYFSPGDVGSGAPESWVRAEEYSTSAALFTSNQQPASDIPVCEALQVDLDLNVSPTWVEIIPEDFPNEKWYVTTVFYQCVFEMVPDVTYITVPGAKAQLTVRQSGDQWRLVEWRDLGSSASQTTISSEIAWGAIKLLYREP